MTGEERIEQAIGEALAEVCRCDPAYTDRGRHGPNCGDEGELAIRAFLAALSAASPVVVEDGKVTPVRVYGNAPAVSAIDGMSQVSPSYSGPRLYVVSEQEDTDGRS